MPSLEYEHENVLKKVHVGNTDYYFKDEDLRNSVENFGTAVNKDAVETLDSSGTDLPTEAAVADYIDDFKTNEVDPKASVALGSDEELIFNYIPVASSSSSTYTITYMFGPNQVIGDLIIQVTSVPESIEINAGDSLEDHLSEPMWIARDGNGNTVENPSVSFTGWCTDSSDPSNTKVSFLTRPESDLELYPVFEAGIILAD